MQFWWCLQEQRNLVPELPFTLLLAGEPSCPFADVDNHIHVAGSSCRILQHHTISDSVRTPGKQVYLQTFGWKYKSVYS